jgi:hypothetical protein
MVLGRFIDIIMAIAAATWIVVAGMNGQVRAATYDTSRLDRMPDFSQTDRALGLPGGGTHYCVPVATANVLVWLAEYRGFKNLLPVRGLTTHEKVASVAARLGSPELMSTAPKGGTNLQKFVNGLSAYVKAAGYRASIEAHGPVKFSGVSYSHVGAPDMYNIRRQFARGAGVWVSIGFYREGKRPGALYRLGGHMTTMAGFGVDESGRTDRDVIILHDPDDGYSAGIKRRYLRLEPLRDGYFAGPGGGRLAEASGFPDVTDGFSLKPGHRAIITSVFVLNM